jgi:hypothetical protein
LTKQDFAAADFENIIAEPFEFEKRNTSQNRRLRSSEPVED